jgi:hypothetical protein
MSLLRSEEKRRNTQVSQVYLLPFQRLEESKQQRASLSDAVNTLLQQYTPLGAWY